jgi:hypothetical protein
MSTTAAQHYLLNEKAQRPEQSGLNIQDSSLGHANNNIQSTTVTRRVQKEEKDQNISAEPSEMPTFLVHIVLPEGVNVVTISDGSSEGTVSDELDITKNAQEEEETNASYDALSTSQQQLWQTTSPSLTPSRSIAAAPKSKGQVKDETTHHKSDVESRSFGDISGIRVSVPRQQPPPKDDIVAPSMAPTAIAMIRESNDNSTTTTTASSSSNESQAPSDGPSMTPSSINNTPNEIPIQQTLPRVGASVMASDFPSSIPSRTPALPEPAAPPPTILTSGENPPVTQFGPRFDGTAPAPSRAALDTTAAVHENELASPPNNNTSTLQTDSPNGASPSVAVVAQPPSPQLGAAQTYSPSGEPIDYPSLLPSFLPSREPISDPTSSPTTEPTFSPSSSPTSKPSFLPSREPISNPTSRPTTEPTFSPSSSPTSKPSFVPSREPISNPTSTPTVEPTSSPTSSSPTTFEPTTFRPTSSPTTEKTGIVVVDEVALYTTGEALMSAEDVSLFERVCETEFLPHYLSLVYSANYTEIGCTVIGQSMVEEGRMLTKPQQRQEQEKEQHHLQNATVLLKSSTTNILLQVAGVVNSTPKDDQSFEDIVGMTFSTYSEEFQALLGEQTSYFQAQPKNIPSDATEETRGTAINSDKIPIIYIVAAAVGGITILALGFGFFAIRRRRGNKMAEIEIDSLEIVTPRRKPVDDDEVPRFLVTCTSTGHDHEISTNACESKDQAMLRASSPHSPSHTSSPRNSASAPLSVESSQASSSVSLQEGSHRTASDTTYTKRDETGKSSSSSCSDSDSSTPLVRRRVKYFNRIASRTGPDGHKRPPGVSASVETDISSLRDASFVSSRTGSRMSDSIRGAGPDDSGSAYTNVDYSCSDATSPRGGQLRHLSTVDITKSPVNKRGPLSAQGPIRLRSVKEDDALTTVTGDSRAEIRTELKPSPNESMLTSKGNDTDNESESLEPLNNNVSSRSSPGTSGETSSISSGVGEGGEGSSNTNFVTEAKTTILESVRQTSLFSAFGNFTFSSNSSSNSSTAASATSRSNRTEDTSCASEISTYSISSAPVLSTEVSTKNSNGVESVSGALQAVESIEATISNNRGESIFSAFDNVEISHSITVTSEDKNKRPATATTAHPEPIMAATNQSSSAIMSSASNSSSAIMSARPPRPPPSTTGGEQAVDKVLAGQSSSAIMSSRPPRPPPSTGGEQAVSSTVADDVVDLTELARKDHVGT